MRKNVKDFREIKESLKRFRGALSRDPEDEALSTVYRILDLGISMCPVDTGALQGSGRMEPYGPRQVVIKFGGAEFINPKTGRPVDYAILVHDGTSKMPGRPFLWWAIQMVLGEWSYKVARRLENVV